METAGAREYDTTVDIAESQYYLGEGEVTGDLRQPISSLSDGGLVLLTSDEDTEMVELRLILQPSPPPADTNGPECLSVRGLAFRTWEGDPVDAPMLPPGRWMPELRIASIDVHDGSVVRERHVLTFYALDETARGAATRGWAAIRARDTNPPSRASQIADGYLRRPPGTTILTWATDPPGDEPLAEPHLIQRVGDDTLRVISDTAAQWEWSVEDVDRPLPGTRWQVREVLMVPAGATLRILDGQGRSVPRLPDPLATGPAKLTLHTLADPDDNFLRGPFGPRDIWVVVALTSASP